MSKAILVVRAEVPAPERQRFDHWYEADHLPWAMRAFAARRAWRCWRRGDPPVHLAFYEFASAAAAEAVVNSDVMAPLVADFDRVWGENVRRSREIIEIVQELVP